MNNPCLLLNPDHEGLNIQSTPQALSILISNNFTSPLMLPEAKTLNICLSSNTEAHFFASNSQVNLVLEPGSHAYWYGLSNTKLSLFAQVKSKARLNITQINLGSVDAQTSMNIELLAPHAEVSFIGLDQLTGQERSSTALHINHKTSSTKSTQAFRGIYNGHSLGLFEGKVSVAPHAESSSAKQLYKSILLSENARAHVKPELEINNFDITASHGASIGQLDQEALFYLCTRGLSKEAAQKILVMSLARDILQEIHPSHA